MDVDKFKALLDAVEAKLQGEPARVIGYGSAVIVWLVAGLSGSIPNIPFDAALGDTAAAITLVVGVIETIRRYVSPASKASSSLGGE